MPEGSSSKKAASPSTTDPDFGHRLQVAAYRRRSRFALSRGNQIVPEGTVAGHALVVVIAIMSFLACLTLGAVSLVRDASREWQLDIQKEVTIQVRPIDGVNVVAETEKAAALARATRGVTSAQVLDDAANLRLLQPWLGSGFDLTDLPIPRLIEVKLADAEAVDLPDLSRRLAAEVRGASLNDHQAWASRLQSLADTTVVGGIVILALVFVATVLCVVFATRGAMATNHGVVAVLHLVGAEDGFIAREFQRHFLLLGLRGGLIGAGAAALLFTILGFVVMPILSINTADVSALFGRFAVGPIGYFGALAIAFLIAVLTALTSRLTVYRHLADAE
jgi:cell division transport system permease protein